MILDQKSLLDILQNDSSEPLNDVLEIEDIITLVKDVENKVDFLEKLKKKRTEVIKIEIEKLNVKKDKFKNIIMKTLEKFGHKSLNFPGIGKVGVKNFSGSWEIKDEEKMLDYLQRNLKKDDLDMIIVNKPSVSKKELNKLLDDFISSGQTIDFAEKTKDEKSVSISYDKNETIDTNSVPEEEDKQVDLKTQYDGVEF